MGNPEEIDPLRQQQADITRQIQIQQTNKKRREELVKLAK